MEMKYAIPAVILLLVVSMGTSSIAYGAIMYFENKAVYSIGTESQTRPDVAVGKNGEIYVAWCEFYSGLGKYRIMFTYSTDGGNSWLANPAEVGLANLEVGPSLAVDADGRIHVAYCSLYDAAFPTHDWCVKEITIGPGGAVSVSYDSANSHGDDNYIGVIELAAGGAPGSAYTCIVYNSTDGFGYDEICMRRSDLNDWTTETIVAPGTFGKTYSKPTISAYSNKLAVAYERNGTAIDINTDDGSGFSQPKVITEYNSSNPSIAYYKNDVYVTWSSRKAQGASLYDDIKCAHGAFKDGAWSWSPARTVDDANTATYANESQVAVTESGIVYILWLDGRFDAYCGNDVYYDVSSDKGATFSKDVRLNKDYSSALQSDPAIGCGFGYGPFVVWHDRRSTPYKVFFEDLSTVSTYALKAVYEIGGESFPQYKVNDIIRFQGSEIEGDTYLCGMSGTERLTCAAPPARSNHAIATIGGTSEVLLFGGYNESAKAPNGDYWAFNISTKQWTNLTPLNPSGPSAREEHALATIYGDDCVLLFGGSDGAAELGDTWVYDRSANTWTQRFPASSPPARMGHAMAGIYGTDKVLLFGGNYYSSGSIVYLDDTWLYDYSDDTWTQIFDFTTGPRSMHSMATVCHTTDQYRYVVLACGRNAVGLPDDTYIFRYDTGTGAGNWLGFAIDGPCGRTNASMATVYGTEVVSLYGGEDQTGMRLNDGWGFDFALMKWISGKSGLSERSEHAMAGFEGRDKLLIFGGNSTYHYYALGGEGYMSIVKNSENTQKATHFVLSSVAGGSSCRINSLALRGDNLIGVGASTAHAEIWQMRISDDSGGTVDSLGISWLDSYDELLEVCYGGQMAATLISAVRGTSSYLLRTDKDFSNAFEYASTFPICAICYNYTSSYYVFSYDSLTNTNHAYTQNGSTGGALVEITISAGALPKGRINDARSVIVSTSPPAVFTYLASNALSGATRGLHRMASVGYPAEYSCIEIDVNGDSDTYYFNYTALDVTMQSGPMPIIYILAVGGCSYVDKTTGFYAIAAEVEYEGSWFNGTFDFSLTDKSVFYACAMFQEEKYGGNKAAIGGATSSPGLYLVGGNIEADADLNVSVAQSEPIIEDAKITVPGDDPAVTNRMNEQFTPTGTDFIEFHVNVTIPNTLSTLHAVKFQAWYDDPDCDGAEDEWQEVCANDDKNARVEIIAARSGGDGAGSYTFAMAYPTKEEVNFNSTYCTAYEYGLTVMLKFVYAPMKQSRYAFGGTYQDGSSTVSTWNFQITVVDDTGERSPVGGAYGNEGDGWEFGLQRVTSLVGIMNRTINGGNIVDPLDYAATENFTLAWSSNNDYKFSVEMKSPLAKGADTIGYTNIMVHKAFNCTYGYPGNDFTADNGLHIDDYSSFDNQYRKLYWYGDECSYWDAPSSGNEQNFSTNFLVYVPLGTKSGSYTAVLTYVLDISPSPCSPRLPSLDPSWLATGATSDYFGETVSSAGDVNGDGFEDVVVASFRINLNRGKVVVYNGSSSGLDYSNPWTVYGENANDYFGFAAASAGDVNGDGFDDLIIGAHGFNGGGTSGQGKVYIYHGSPTGLGDVSKVILGSAAGETFGHSVACAGDVNRDGYDDIIVGAPYSNSNTGKMAIYYGSSSGIVESGAVAIPGETTDSFYGFSVAGAGDVNGDGFDDVVVGAYRYGTYSGRIYVYNGSSYGIGASPPIVATGVAAYTYFGAYVAGAGDVNGDGFDDILVGSPWFNGNRGSIWVFNGSSGGMVSNPITIAGLVPMDCYGRAIAGGGRVDRDGYADIIVGAYGVDSFRGRAYVYRGSPSGLETTPIWTAAGEDTNQMFGLSIGFADTNGDGLTDCIVGAYYISNAGRVYIFT